MASKAKITADPKNYMRRLASDLKLATETVGRAVTEVVNAKILYQHTNEPFDLSHKHHKTAEMQ